jgi:hypothetical protein
MTLSLSAARAERVPTSPLNVVIAGRASPAERGATEVAFVRADMDARSAAGGPIALGDATLEAARLESSAHSAVRPAWRVATTAAGDFTVTADAAFAHRDVSREFAAVVPPPRAPWQMRLAWNLMPTVVALPFGRYILARVAGSR